MRRVLTKQAQRNADAIRRRVIQMKELHESLAKKSEWGALNQPYHDYHRGAGVALRDLLKWIDREEDGDE